jgi:hypothetical protein
VIATVDGTHGIVSAVTAGETNTGYETGEVTFQKKDAATQTAIA